MAAEIDDTARNKEQFPRSIVRIDDFAVIILHQTIEDI